MREENPCLSQDCDSCPNKDLCDEEQEAEAEQWDEDDERFDEEFE